ncbi:MAG: STAS domain-containing protein [Planctomycetota bacterium]
MAELTFDIQELESLPSTALVTLAGAIDVSTVVNFQTTLDSLQLKGIKRFILDVHGVQYVNSTGLGSLVRMADKMNGDGGSFVMIRILPKVRMVFDMLGLASFFKILPDQRAAEEHLRSILGSEAGAAPAAAPAAPAAAQAGGAPSGGGDQAYTDPLVVDANCSALDRRAIISLVQAIAAAVQIPADRFSRLGEVVDQLVEAMKAVGGNGNERFRYRLAVATRRAELAVRISYNGPAMPDEMLAGPRSLVGAGGVQSAGRPDGRMLLFVYR